MPTWLRPGRRGRRAIADKSVFVIKPPEEINSTKYVLIVYRGGGGFGGARPAVVGVDRFETGPDKTSYNGYVGDDLVVTFPGDTSYMLLASNLVSQLSSEEAAQKQKAEQEMLESVFGKDKVDEEVPFPSGMYR